MTGISPELLGQLLDEHGPALVLFASQWSDSPDDCLQDALLELARQAVAPIQPVAWMYRVVRNKAISSARASTRRRKHEAIAAALIPAWSSPAAEPRVTKEELAAALDSLDDSHREVVIAHVWGGLTFDDIATITDSSTSTAHRRYTAAIAHLALRLKSSWNNELPTNEPPSKR
jgi:RNA polymerase sigma factor (sigma-70 family)